MHLFELPPELVQLIFEYIVKSRQLERVMRIRIVSRQFKANIDYLIFRLRLLSQLAYSDCSFRNMEHPFRYKLALPSYVRSYLVYQVLRERSTTSSLGRIYRAAKAICEKDGNTGDEAVITCTNSLMRRAMATCIVTLLREPTAKERTKCSDADLEADLYVAAIYLDKQSYVEGLIADGVELCDVCSGVFGSAFYAATRQGNLASQQREILDSASFLGHQDAFDFALDMRPISLPEESETRRYNGDVRVLERAIRTMPSPQRHERVAAMLGPQNLVFRQRGIEGLTGWLQHWAWLGEIDMVRYFLDKGADPNCIKHGCRKVPLFSATRSDNEAIVKVLLEAGADPNIPHPPDLDYKSPFIPHSPLMEAVWRGNIAIVKLLLSNGANVDYGRPPPIVLAAFKEHMVLFRLLREHGARLDTPETGGWAMALAKRDGLSSMVDVLVREGVGHLHWVPTKCWWRRSLFPKQ
ncbi:hypothetical protein CHU98_g149 [Xylaria longipes]|nr:hypothetical protein CHU98_g149 [Xylaria longipes]